MPTIMIVPGSPALVLSLHDVPSRTLAATIEGAAASCSGPVDIVCPLDEDEYTAHTGSLRAWGAPQVDVPQVDAGGGNYLGELVVRSLLGERGYRPARASLEPLDSSALTVVVVDGPAGLTPRAPLALQPGAESTHEGLQRFIAGAAELPVLEGGVLKPQLWHELAALDVPAGATQSLLAADGTLGVGRYVGVWQW